ncbi:MAG: hypothetical protein LHW60_01370 [Candidatus Cloacimonetes bacterium]|jgi:hypothetical protein|nr:hypothetical protein [Candidatus Cloacimonadota bacterium]MCB5280066.1 hypothetical protein [Candidatus Cloacimonadota bacterium]
MKDDKVPSEAMSSMDSTKYDAEVLSCYAASLLRKNNLIDQGLIQKRGYELKSPDQTCKLVDTLTVNRKPTITF